MVNIQSKERLLDSVISGALAQMGEKFDFWQVRANTGGTLWQSSNSLTPEQAVAMFNPNSDDFKHSSELALLYGITWEFVWGQKPPELVQSLRADLISKANMGFKLNELEVRWFQLITVDTDSF